uniref:Uncharacterized protein n=1 Tax=Nelumbo nucifera TaxID=4432 RepID=A0A822Z2V9_NELNU|nr:TPA_asm: hypothetical protein HUJ06_013685 [Nelumbo nucifera]
MKEKGEAVSDFVKSKSISQQRQYLPIYSIRDELLQMKQAIAVHITSPPGDILIFLTDQDEIDATCYALAQRMEQLTSSTKKGVSKLSILPIYSQLPAD